MTEDLQRQLEILDNSQRLVFISLLGILLQYKSIDAQRDTLLSNAFCSDSVQPACLPDPKTMRLGASLLIILALLGFQVQTEELNRQAAAAGQDPNASESVLNSTAIAIAMIRYLQLVQAACQTPASPNQSELQDNIDELSPLL